MIGWSVRVGLEKWTIGVARDGSFTFVDNGATEFSLPYSPEDRSAVSVPTARSCT